MKVFSSCEPKSLIIFHVLHCSVSVEEKQRTTALFGKEVMLQVP